MGLNKGILLVIGLVVCMVSAGVGLSGCALDNSGGKRTIKIMNRIAHKIDREVRLKKHEKAIEHLSEMEEFLKGEPEYWEKYKEPLTYIRAELWFINGEFANAKRDYKDLLDIRKEKYGPQSAEVVDTMVRLSKIYYYHQNPFLAEDYLEKALEILNNGDFGEVHRKAYVMNKLANLYIAKENCDKGQPLVDEAMSITIANHGEQHPDLALMLINSGKCLLQAKAYKKADIRFQQGAMIAYYYFSKQKLVLEDHMEVFTDYIKYIRDQRLARSFSRYRTSLNKANTRYPDKRYEEFRKILAKNFDFKNELSDDKATDDEEDILGEDLDQGNDVVIMEDDTLDTALQFESLSF